MAAERRAQPVHGSPQGKHARPCPGRAERESRTRGPCAQRRRETRGRGRKRGTAGTLPEGSGGAASRATGRVDLVQQEGAASVRRRGRTASEGFQVQGGLREASAKPRASEEALRQRPKPRRGQGKEGSA